MSRIPRRRLFKITLEGRDSYLEAAGERTALEVQHQLVTEKGFKSARVQELYIGGAKARIEEPEEEEEE